MILRSLSIHASKESFNSLKPDSWFMKDEKRNQIVVNSDIENFEKTTQEVIDQVKQLTRHTHHNKDTDPLAKEYPLTNQILADFKEYQNRMTAILMAIIEKSFESEEIKKELESLIQDVYLFFKYIKTRRLEVMNTSGLEPSTTYPFYDTLDKIDQLAGTSEEEYLELFADEQLALAKKWYQSWTEINQGLEDQLSPKELAKQIEVHCELMRSDLEDFKQEHQIIDTQFLSDIKRILTISEKTVHTPQLYHERVQEFETNHITDKVSKKEKAENSSLTSSHQQTSKYVQVIDTDMTAFYLHSMLMVALDKLYQVFTAPEKLGYYTNEPPPPSAFYTQSPSDDSCRAAIIASMNTSIRKHQW